MAGDVTNWVAEKLVANEDLEIVERTKENFLVVKAKDRHPFRVAVLGVKSVIEVSDVKPLFSGRTKPQFVVNVPSKTLWDGKAIEFIHASSAAFGTLGDVSRAAYLDDPGTYRDKGMGFFIDAIRQHKNVSSVSYVYDTVLNVDRKKGASLKIAVIDAYNMSAEDVRNAKTRVGDFDVVVKSSSYGSITGPAEEAANSMGAQTLTFGHLMQRLSR